MSPDVAGLLLTGGSSRRMGFDKSLLLVDGEPISVRLGRLLGEVASPLVEVGRGCSGLPTVREEPPGSGPLVAVSAGRAELLRIGHQGPALVLACDLPLLDVAVLHLLVGWPGDASVVPVVHGHTQPLCARWSAGDLDAAAVLVEKGVRSMRALLGHSDPVMLDESLWSGVVGAATFADVDVPSDLVALDFEIASSGG